MRNSRLRIYNYKQRGVVHSDKIQNNNIDKDFSLLLLRVQAARHLHVDVRIANI